MTRLVYIAMLVGLLLPGYAWGQAVTIPPYITLVQPNAGGGGGGGGGGGTCTGTVTLLPGGTATVNSSCITATSVPLCVDDTAFNNVLCTPSTGSMTVTGTAPDVITWFMVNTGGSGGGGGGGGGVNSVGAAPPLSVSGTPANPIVSLGVPVLPAFGGTGVVSPTAHTIPVAEGAGAFSLLTCPAGLPLVGNGAAADPACQLLNLSLGTMGTLPSARGGTGVSSPTAHGIMVGEGASPMATVACANNLFLSGVTGADPACRALVNSDLPTSGVAAGTYTSTNLTVNAQGIITSAGNGSGGTAHGLYNGVINVTDPPYNAKGDAVTDDTAAIQLAINGSCGQTGNKQPIYFPPTPFGKSYFITSPLLLNCSTGVTGPPASLNSGASITQNYYGPTIVAQAAETGWKPPLTASITTTWTASTAYGPGAYLAAVAKPSDIVDSNGNIEVQTFFNGGNGCTSGSGVHPVWPTTPVGTTTNDNNCVWVLATTGGQKSIASGAGSSLDADDSEFFNGAGYGTNNATAEIMNPANLENSLNGLANFTVEFYVETFFDDGGNFDNIQLIGIHAGYPENGSLDALKLQMNGSGCVGGTNCLRAFVDIGGVSVGLAAGNGVQLTRFHIHHVAISYDGTTARLFIDGVNVGSSAASGTWRVPEYESFEWADKGPLQYPAMDQVTPITPAFYDSIRISNTARYTANFTPPTAKFVSDANTVFLENFPTTAPTGTIQGLVNNNTNAFIPVETSFGGAALNPAYIGNLQLADNGIYANWMLNSTIENIVINGAGRTCLNLHDNNFQDTVHRFMCNVVPAVKTNVGFLFLNSSNNNLYDHLQCDGPSSCIGAISGSGHYIMPDITGRGQVHVPLYFIGTQALVETPEFDIEGSEPAEFAGVYANGNYAPIVFHGGQMPLGNSTGAYFAIAGGEPIIDTGSFFSGAAAEILNVLSQPTGVSRLVDPTLPVSNPPRTNASNGQYLSVQQDGTVEKTVVANLWSCGAINPGATVDIQDCQTCTFGATCVGGGTTYCREVCSQTPGPTYAWIAE